MWIVTIRTVHETLVHPMLEWHRKLSAHVRVAAVTNIRLFLGEKILIRLRLVNRVTRGADHINLRMITPPDIRTIHILRVTSQTRVQRLIGCKQ